MVWPALLVIVTLTISILTNVVSSWIEPKLHGVKGATILLLLFLAFLSGLILEKKDVKLPFNLDEAVSSLKTLNKKKIALAKQIPKGIPNTVRDKGGHLYVTFMFKNKTWLGENLNLVVEDSYCYDKDDSKCKIYGRQYTYESALKACNELGKFWRLPTTQEMKELLMNNDGGYQLAKNIWATDFDVFGNPLQGERNMTEVKKSGFNAVAGGAMVRGNLYGAAITQSAQLGVLGHYWLSSTIGDNPRPYIYSIRESKIYYVLELSSSNFNNLCSCRCVKDAI